MAIQSVFDFEKQFRDMVEAGMGAIRSIFPVKGPRRTMLLNRLWLDDNSISDISAVSGLTSLTILWLSNNNISDIASLVENAGIDERDDVRIDGNLLNCEDPATRDYITLLEDRGVSLAHDCSQE